MVETAGEFVLLSQCPSAFNNNRTGEVVPAEVIQLTRTFPHLKQVVTSLALIVTAAVIISFGDYLTARKSVLGEAEGETNRVARHLSSLLVSQELSPGVDFTQAPDMTSEHVLRIRKVMRDFELVNVRIFSTEGTILYSGDLDLVGSKVKVQNGLEEALRGKSSSHLATPGGYKERIDGSGTSIPLLETYAPIVSPSSGKVIGAYEIYQDFRPLGRRIRAEALRNSLTHVLLLLIFAALFFRYGRLTALTMEEEHHRLIDELEDRVEERTQDLVKSRHRINELLDHREEMYRNLVIADEYKKNFIGLVSHELRTPLTVMKGYLSLMKERVLPTPQTDEFAEALEVSINEARKLENLINNILELGQLDRGLIKVIPETFRIQGVLDEATGSLESDISERGVMVRTSVHPDVATFTSDRMMVLQAVNQYLSNAVKFSPEGGEILISAGPSHRGLVISVRDKGPGIPEAQVSDIFDLFYQADISSTRSYEGSGLGLAIVRRISRVLGGRVWVESGPGQGSSFFLEIPAMSERQRESNLEEDAVTNLLPTRQTAGGSVLVVDDDPDFRDLIRRLLESNGYVVELARDGLEALLRLLGGASPLPSLIVMDVRMPNVNGIDTCRVLKRNVLTREIPIVVVSALAGQEDIREGMACGANAYLTKPFDTEELLRRIQFLTAK